MLEQMLVTNMSRMQKQKIVQIHGSSETRAGISISNPTLAVPFSVTCTTYIQRVGPQASDNSFNDRAHKHIYNLQWNRDICHFKNLGQPGKQPCKSHFPSFLYINFHPTTKQHPPHMREI